MVENYEAVWKGWAMGVHTGVLGHRPRLGALLLEAGKKPISEDVLQGLVSYKHLSWYKGDGITTNTQSLYPDSFIVL